MVIIHLAITALAITVGKLDQDLDPGTLTWWQESWSEAPIVLDSNHVGTVSASFFYRTSTSLTDGYIEVICPSTVTCSSPSNGPLDFTQNGEYSTVFSIQFTSAGTFGPFGLLTRNADNQKMADVNLIFGSVAVLTAAPTGSLTVTNDASSVGIETVVDLTFEFTLTVDLWKHDLIKLTTDSNYQGPSNPTCTSEDIDTVDNLLKGPEESHTLPCDVDSNGNVIIYGISEAVDSEGNYQVKIKVTGYTTPSQVQSSFSWGATVYRFGTSTILEDFSGTGSPFTITAGSISGVTFVPYLGLDIERVVNGMNLFMKLSFTTSHEIPAQGIIDITFSNADPATLWYTDSGSDDCMVISHISSVTCVASIDAVKITIGASAVAAGQFQVVTRNLFASTSASISSITSTTSDPKDIDSTSTQGSFTYTTATTHKLVGYHVEANKGTLGTDNKGNGYTSSTIMFQISSGGDSVDLTTDDTLQFTCPFLTTGSVALKSMVIATDAAFHMDSSDSHTAATTSANPDYTGGTTISITSVASTISVDAQLLFQAAEQGSDDGKVIAPLVFSNLGTFYECWVVASHDNAGTIDRYQVGEALLEIDNGEPTTLQFGPICIDTKKPPMMHSIGDDYFTFDSSNNYQILFDLQYPMSLGTTTEMTGVTQNNQSVTVIMDNDYYKVLISDIPTISAGTTQYIYHASGVTSKGLYGMWDTIRYQDTTFGVTNSIFYKAGSTNYASVSSDNDVDFPFQLTNPTTFNPQDNLDMSFTFNGRDGSGGGIGFFNICFNKIQSVDSDFAFVSGFTNQRTFSFYYQEDFSYHCIIADQSDASSIQNSVTSFTVNGINVYTWDVALSILVNQGNLDGNGIPDRAACIATNSVSPKPTAIQFQPPTVSISDCGLKGPDNYDVTMQITAQIETTILETGTITIVILQYSEGASSTCSTNTGDSCTLTTDTIIVTAGASGISIGTITVTLTGLVPPTSGAAGDSVNLISSIISEIWGDKIQAIYDTPTASCTLAAAGSQGTISISTVQVYPNAPSLSNVDVQLVFSIPKTLSVGATIDIKILSEAGSFFSGTSGSIADQCWADIVYSACTVSSGTVSIVIDQAYTSGSTIEVYFDRALTLTGTAGVTTDTVEISAEWTQGSVVVASGKTDLTVGAATTGVVTPDSSEALKVENSNAGEASDYTFKFQVDTALDETHNIWIVFPNTYDPYFGNAQESELDGQSGIYLIDCESESFQDLECAVDHWMIILTGLDDVDPNTDISITISKGFNPEQGTTSNFQIYVINSADSSVMAAQQSFGTATITAVPSVLELKEVKSLSHYLADSSDFTVSFYTTETLNLDWIVAVEFPWQYDLSLTQSDSITCNSNYYDETAESNEAIELSSTDSCILDGNVAFYVIDDAASLTGSSTNKITLTLYNVFNPDWGLQREVTDDDRLWDDEDQDVFEVYDYWSTRFRVYLIDETSLELKYRSFDNLNSAYLGFDWEEENGVSIGDYEPNTGSNGINAYIGTQTDDLSITLDDSQGVWPLVSEQLILEPFINTNTPNSHVQFSSWTHDFTYFQWGLYSIDFRIAVGSASSEGMFYIEWETEEVTEDWASQDQYNSPSRVLLIISDVQDYVDFEISGIPDTLYTNQISLPIKVQVQNAPATSVSLSLTVDSDLIQLIPSQLDFSPDVNTLYFQIFIDSTYDPEIVENDPIITYTVSGTDMNYFTTPLTTTLDDIQLQVQSEEEDPAQITVVAGTPGLNTGSVTITSDQDSVVYWYFGCEGLYVTYEDLVLDIEETYGNFTQWTGHSPYDMQYAQIYQNTTVNLEQELDLEEEEEADDILDYFWELRHEYCEEYYFGAMRVEQDQDNTLSFTELSDGSSYTFGAYVTNSFSNTIVGDVEEVTFDTDESPNTWNLILSMDDDISESDMSDIEYIIAESIGINTLWLYNGKRQQTEDSDGAIESSIFTWAVLYSDTHSSITSEEISKEIDTSDATNMLLQEYTDLNSGDISWSQDQNVDSEIIGLFLEDVTLAEGSKDSLTFDVQISVDGYVFAVCIDEEDEEIPVSSQVVSGTDAGGMALDSWGYIELEAGVASEIEIDSLEEDTDYNCYFVICNDYVPKPTCQSDETDLETVNEGTDFGLMKAITGIIVGVILAFN